MKITIVNLTGEFLSILRKPPEHIVGSTGDPLYLDIDPNAQKQ